MPLRGSLLGKGFRCTVAAVGFGDNASQPGRMPPGLPRRTREWNRNQHETGMELDGPVLLEISHRYIKVKVGVGVVGDVG